MEFSSTAQQAVYEKVLPMARELFGEFAIVREDVPVIGLVVGSTLAQIGVFPWGDDDAVVNARAYVVFGAEITPELMLFLLRKNNEVIFGAFGLDDSNDIFFEHAIVGSTCDREELRASVLAVAYTADMFDDEIASRWGGQRAADRWR